MDKEFNYRLRQVIFLLLLVGLAWVTIKELYDYLPGILGAVALYIISRENYFQLVYKKKWKKGWTSLLYILIYFLLLGLPIFLAVKLVSPKVNAILNDPTATIAQIRNTLTIVEQKIGFDLISEQTINNMAGKVSAMLPSLFNSTAIVIANLAMMLFLLYYMLYSGSEIEKYIVKIIPLKDENIKLLAAKTKVTIKSNAIGIPLISLIQGFTAAIGYMIFGVKDVALWAFLTGVFSFFPVVGTMIVWVPLCIYMYATGDAGLTTGLVLYNIIVTGNIDYFARITIMKRMGDVHPVITLVGVILGLNLFGLIGLIFGPLMMNYIIVLFQIYINEFSDDVTPAAPANDKEITQTS